jgi:TPR repeat protein
MNGEWFSRGHAAWEAGRLLSAFRLFLIGAKAGDSACQQNLGYFYEEGIGVSIATDKAIYWYGRACKEGRSAAAAYNLGLIHRGRGNHKEAERFFKCAVKYGDPDALLELAEIEVKKGKGLRAKEFLQALVEQGSAVTPSVLSRAKRRLNALVV